jgi:hypothetical protein
MALAPPARRDRARPVVRIAERGLDRGPVAALPGRVELQGAHARARTVEAPQRFVGAAGVQLAGDRVEQRAGLERVWRRVVRPGHQRRLVGDRHGLAAQRGVRARRGVELARPRGDDPADRPARRARPIGARERLGRERGRRIAQAIEQPLDGVRHVRHARLLEPVERRAVRRRVAARRDPRRRELAQRHVRIAQELDQRGRRRLDVRRQPRGHHRRVRIEQRRGQRARLRGPRRRLDRDRPPRRPQVRQRVRRRRREQLGAHLGGAAEHREHLHRRVAHAPERIAERRLERGQLARLPHRRQRVDRGAPHPPHAIAAHARAQRRARRRRAARRERADHRVAHERQAIADRLEQPRLDLAAIGARVGRPALGRERATLERSARGTAILDRLALGRERARVGCPALGRERAGAGRPARATLAARLGELAQPARRRRPHAGILVGEQQPAQRVRQPRPRRRADRREPRPPLRVDQARQAHRFRLTSRAASASATDACTSRSSLASSASIQKCSTRVPATACERRNCIPLASAVLAARGKQRLHRHGRPASSS